MNNNNDNNNNNNKRAKHDVSARPIRAKFQQLGS